MNFKEFQDELLELLKKDIPESEGKLEIRKITTLDKSYTALVLNKQMPKVTPCINLDDQFYNYLDGMDIKDIAKAVSRLVTETVDPYKDWKWMTDYNEAKKRLYIRVCNTDNKQEYLANVPHIEVEDLSVTYHILIKEDESGIASTIINNDLMKNYGITFEQLHADAVENSQKLVPVKIEKMSNILGEMAVSDNEAANEMIVVTNAIKTNGAAAFFYPDVMDEIAERFGGDFVMLPSSIHEVIAIPDKEDTDLMKLEMMVRVINLAETKPEDKLSDHVYHYDHVNRIFELGETYHQRMMAKEKLEQFLSEPIRNKKDLKLS